MSQFDKRNRRGNAIIFGISMIPLLGFASLSVDLGLQRMTEVQIQAASEAASAAGSSYLDASTQGLLDAINGAVAVGNLNDVYGDYTFTANDVELGWYEDGQWSTRTTASDPTTVNAVRVEPTHTHGTFLAKVVFQTDTLDVAGSATSVQPRGGIAKYVDCYLPFAIPTCHFENLEDGTNPDPMNLDLSNLNTVGWGLAENLNVNNPNTKVIEQQLSDTCANGTAVACDEADLVDQGNGQYACAGDGTNVQISNGQNNAAVNHFGDVVNGDTAGNPEPWPTNYFGDSYDRDGTTANLWTPTITNQSLIDQGRWGWNINGAVPIIQQSCGANFTGEAAIVGWTYAYIYDAKTQGAGGKNIWMQFDFVNDYDIGYGQCEGDCYGNVTGTEPPVMVY